MNPIRLSTPDELVAAQPKTPASIVILTLNEERNLAGCLASLTGFDDVHVLDAGSVDSTTEVARSAGVQVNVNPFQGFGQQRNWAIDNISSKYEWQFHLDADERMTPELAAELRSVIALNPSHGGFRVPSKQIFAGRWLKRAGQYPGYQVRLFHRDRLRFRDYGHGQREVTRHSLGVLREPYLHLAFSKGLDDWFAKHAVYARREAEQALQPEVAGASGSLFSWNPTDRRRALKRLSMAVPGRYSLRMAYMLCWRLAFLDGWAGVTYARMLAAYEAMIEVNLAIQRRNVRP